MNHRYALLSLPFLGSLALLIVNDHYLKAAYPSALTGKLSDVAGLFAFVYFLSVVGAGAYALLGRGRGLRLSPKPVGRCPAPGLAPADEFGRGRTSEAGRPSVRPASPPVAFVPVLAAGGRLFARTWGLVVACGTGLAFAWWKHPASEAALATWNALGVWPLQRTIDPTDLWALLIIPVAFLHFIARHGEVGFARRDGRAARGSFADTRHRSRLLALDLAGEPTDRAEASRSSRQFSQPDPAHTQHLVGRRWRTYTDALVAHPLTRGAVAAVALWSFVATSIDDDTVRLSPDRPIPGRFALAGSVDTVRRSGLDFGRVVIVVPGSAQCLFFNEVAGADDVEPLPLESLDFFVAYTLRLSPVDSVSSQIDSVRVNSVVSTTVVDGSIDARYDSAFAALPDSLLVARFERAFVEPLREALTPAPGLAVGVMECF